MFVSSFPSLQKAMRICVNDYENATFIYQCLLVHFLVYKKPCESVLTIMRMRRPTCGSRSGS